MGRPNVNWSVGIALDKHSTYTSKTIKAGIPFAQQVIGPDMKYIVKYDFSLGGESVEIPENCILEFDGGSISNGTIIGNNTQVYAKKVEVFSGITIDGTWAVPEITTAWFADIEQSDVVKQAFNLCSDDCYNVLTVENGEYWVHVDDNLDGHYAIGLYSHMHLILIGTIKTFGNSYGDGKTIYGSGKTDILITGNGSVYGDKLTHIYDDGNTYPDGYRFPDGPAGSYDPTKTAENAHIFAFLNCTDVTIDGINIEEATGDGIDVFHSTIDPRNFIIRNFRIYNCRRQGITFGCSSGIIENGYIGKIRGTNPQCGIDLEISRDFASSTHIKRVVVRNIKIDDVNKGFQIRTNGITPSPTPEDPAPSPVPAADMGIITFQNIEIPNCQFAFWIENISDNILIQNCVFKMHYKNGGLWQYTNHIQARADFLTIDGCVFDYDETSIPDLIEYPNGVYTAYEPRPLFDFSSHLDSNNIISMLSNKVRATKFYFNYHRRNVKFYRNDIYCYGLEPDVHTYSDDRSLYVGNYLDLGEGGISIYRPSIDNNVIYLKGGTVRLYGRCRVSNNLLYISVKSIESEETDKYSLFNFLNASSTPHELCNNIIWMYSSAESQATSLKSLLSFDSASTRNTFKKIIGNDFVNYNRDVPIFENTYLALGEYVRFDDNYIDGGMLMKTPHRSNFEQRSVYRLPTSISAAGSVLKHSIFGARYSSYPISSLYRSVSSATNKTLYNFEFFPTTFAVYIGDDISGGDESHINAADIAYDKVIDLSLAVNLKTALTPGLDVYLKAKWNNGRTAVKFEEPESGSVIYSQSLPTSADGYLYILLGKAVTSTHVHLCTYQYKYEFVDGGLKIFETN